jgi:hypothetical protein
MTHMTKSSDFGSLIELKAMVLEGPTRARVVVSAEG